MINKILFFFLCSVSIVSLGQKRSISGTIVDKDTQKTLPNVNIVILGTTSGTITNEDGNFELELKKSNKQIIASHIGYSTTSVEVKGENGSLKIELAKEVILLTTINIALGEYTGPNEYVAFDTKIYQETILNKNEGEGDLMIVEEHASFFNGVQNIYAFFAANFIYPKQVLAENQKGRIFLEFKIGADGFPFEPKIVLGATQNGVEEEILRVFNKMPKWYPATQRGTRVVEKFVLPILYASNGQ
jgi:hypothetical protein